MPDKKNHLVEITVGSRYRTDRKTIRQAVNSALEKHKIKRRARVSIVIAGSRKIKSLNRKFRQINQTADVLSFPLSDTEDKTFFLMPPSEILELGDVVISYPQAVKAARLENKMVDRKISELAEHGIEHLLGIHHA